MVDNKHDIIGSPLTALSFVFPYFDREPRRHIKRLFAAVPPRAPSNATRFNFDFSHAFSWILHLFFPLFQTYDRSLSYGEQNPIPVFTLATKTPLEDIHDRKYL